MNATILRTRQAALGPRRIGVGPLILARMPPAARESYERAARQQQRTKPAARKGASRAEVRAVLDEALDALSLSRLAEPFRGSLMDGGFEDVRWRAVPASWTARATAMIDFACAALGHDGPRPRPLFYDRVQPGQPWGFARYGAREIALATDVPREHQMAVLGHETWHTFDPLSDGGEEGRATRFGKNVAEIWNQSHRRER